MRPLFALYVALHHLDITQPFGLGEVFKPRQECRVRVYGPHLARGNQLGCRTSKKTAARCQIGDTQALVELEPGERGTGVKKKSVVCHLPILYD